MKNKILTLFRNNIPYIKELRMLSGSVTASILMQQLDYWFEKSPNGFYKFLEPCENSKYYKKGDSWTEELGFSKAEFKTAFEKIGVTYKSKKEFTEALKTGNLFQGKFYCCYIDRIKNITVYYRNHDFLDLELEKLINSVSKDSSFTVNQDSLFTDINKVDLRENKVNDRENKGKDKFSVSEESSSPYVNKVNFDITETTTENKTTSREGKNSEEHEKEKSSSKGNNNYRRHSQNENIQVKEVEEIWKECKLSEYKYPPVENINIAIKTYGLLEILQAIQRISKSSLMREKTNIDSFFNKNNDFDQIRKTINGSYDDRKNNSEENKKTSGYSMEDLKNTFS